MTNTSNCLTATDTICKDKMRLTVTHISPTYQRKSEKEIKQEISVRLYQIFKNYV